MTNGESLILWPKLDLVNYKGGIEYIVYKVCAKKGIEVDSYLYGR
jgi:hypothetical protein